MPAKPNAQKWNDVQTAIATVAVVTTLGMWNLFAEPEKTVTAQAQEPQEPTAPPTELPVSPELTAVPQVKIMFTQTAPQTTVVQQPQVEKKKKKKNNNNGGGGGGGGSGSVSVTQTQSS
jgi:hypothetical protein